MIALATTCYFLEERILVADIRTVIKDLNALEESLGAAGNHDGETRIARIRSVLQRKENDPAACIYTVDHILKMLRGSPGLFKATKPGETPNPQRQNQSSDRIAPIVRSCTSFLEDHGR